MAYHIFTTIPFALGIAAIALAVQERRATATQAEPVLVPVKVRDRVN